ncbi:hypothetical protein [Nocardia brasiliensis]|uniref:hypothetical protein n=1 Tax=Nocardia brasiliensis TaxID=37326 RepID=UPI003D8DAF83
MENSINTVRWVGGGVISLTCMVMFATYIFADAPKRFTLGKIGLSLLVTAAAGGAFVVIPSLFLYGQEAGLNIVPDISGGYH